MIAAIVRVVGGQDARRYPVSGKPVTFGRGEDNDIVLMTPSASRHHAELRKAGDSYLLTDRGSSNGTWVNGEAVTERQLRPGDEIVIGDEVFRFELSDVRATVEAVTMSAADVPVKVAAGPVLNVTVTGGGPVGLSFALLLDHLMGPRVAVKVYDGRWQRDGGKIVWKGPEQGNVRRMQVVTIQSRQFLKLPPHVQNGLFTPGAYTEMWPQGPDSIEDLGPRNIRIAYVEDRLLALANEAQHLELIPEPFDATAREAIAGQHVLAICEGGKSRTFEHFTAKFGAADPALYSLDGTHVQDMVLGLRVKSELPDPMAVLLTVTQNRFLLNSLRGEGFLNMRLTEAETKEVVGIDPVRQVFTECIQAGPCLLERQTGNEFFCGAHHALFLPALLKGSAFWARVEQGLELFGVRPENLTAVTGFRLDMVQRPRFSVELYPRTGTSPATYGFLLGDAANAIHFWPGRGLNSGLASAISLARCLAGPRRGALRDADFIRHEAVMAMLQYRHKSRAWRQMVTTDEAGTTRTIKDLIAQGISEGEQGAFDQAADFDALLQRLASTRGRLAARIDGLPDDETLRAHLQRLPPQLLHTLLVSEPWDSGNVGGEEVDVEWLLEPPRPPRPRQPADARLAAQVTTAR
jgi:FHA domain-containing protein